MSSFGFFLLCIQACLISSVYSQYLGCGPALAPTMAMGVPAMPLAAPMYDPIVRGGCGAAYGGSGIGNLAVAGELPVAGTTAVAGQVPIIGAVEFAGPAAAAGAVTIAGSCGCGCGAPYMY
ncbi:chorion class CA protein ERA.1 [Manduca sexta]|uniref:Uncharacterized protein n=1 Tax=Manduca sexta TaxID=7130 RepID=A0A921YWZ4_MANSE|nr:chorion class CA protein ERA.1 [Manduca sexta]KAG6447177.1 hypothetical protein O3G_MSEX004835 [Manduca sexta]KAG6447178.1 hypothetical protein O3G_MSEX004835 [Manduca sexta]